MNGQQRALAAFSIAMQRKGSLPGEQPLLLEHPIPLSQVSGKNDHQYFGRPEHATNERPIYLADASNPGADLAAEYAAGFAAAASLLASVGDKQYADKLFSHAQQAFAFATAFKAK